MTRELKTLVAEEADPCASSRFSYGSAPLLTKSDGIQSFERKLLPDFVDDKAKPSLRCCYQSSAKASSSLRRKESH